jgi:hypothetical protein
MILVPVEAPELSERGGFPWTLKERWVSPGWLSEEDAAYERCDEGKYVHPRAHHHGCAYGAERCQGETRDNAQGRVEDGVSCGIVEGGSDTLYEVVGGVKRYKIEEQSG